MGTFARTLLVLLLVLGVGAAAFYGGMYKQRRDSQAIAEQTAAAPAQPPAQAVSDFERRRREVDAAPARLALQMAREQGEVPMTSHDPEFLYLYGRALLLSAKYADAITAFAKAAEILKARPARDPLLIETRLAAAAAAIKAGNAIEREKAGRAFEEVLDPDRNSPSATRGNENGNRVPGGTNSSVSPPVALPR